MPIAPNEYLSRYILFSKHFRKDGTVKQDAFIPYPYPDLSVTRHKNLSEKQIWTIGKNIAECRKRTLYARSVLQTKDYNDQNLEVQAAPVVNNCNHANVTGWPKDKPSQKIIALELSKTAGEVIFFTQ